MSVIVAYRVVGMALGQQSTNTVAAPPPPPEIPDDEELPLPDASLPLLLPADEELLALGHVSTGSIVTWAAVQLQ